ncbi:MAG: hypothetical protein QNJ17_11630 [Desulfocapsaceae bacterium]|nr:hypothetical protein [Desulfocapsaceae bacterium]
MTSELSRRLKRVKRIALLSMREQTGPCHLAAWWESFVSTIPNDADFADLDRETQQLIRSWEEKLSDETASNYSF